MRAIWTGTPARGFWDQALLEDVLADRRFGYPVDHRMVGEGQILIVPGPANRDLVEKITAEINEWPWVLMIVTSDEEGQFAWWDVSHPTWRLWVQSPMRDGDFTAFGTGYPPQCLEHLQGAAPEKLDDWFFAGQVTHERRQECVKILRGMQYGTLVETEGFTQGLQPADYYDALKRAKVAPCPSGPLTPDTFRLYEALEAGCLPVVDRTPISVKQGYWARVYGHVPFPVVDSWSELPAIIKNLDWPADVNRAGSWWAQHKRSLIYRMSHQIEDMSGVKAERGKMTVLMPTSPIPSHPDTRIIEETVRSVRERTDAEILIMADGVRPEQEHLRARYEEYQRRLIWWAARQDSICVIRSDVWLHQAGITQRTLPIVETPLILFVEHDAPLMGDIPFPDLQRIVGGGTFDVIRLHSEVKILPEHEYLLVDKEPWRVFGQPVLPTVQWSQRPHLARTRWYRDMLDKYFPASARTMIEDRIHGLVQSDGWGPWKVGVYAPENMQRSGHLDARGSEPKFEMRYR